MGAQEYITKLPFPVTAPTSGQTDYVIAGPLTGAMIRGLRRVELTLRSSHDSAASGLSFEITTDNDTTYRLFTAYSHLAATATNPYWIYDIAMPMGITGFKILYDNSANVLTAWTGAIALIFDERAAP